MKEKQSKTFDIANDWARKSVTHLSPLDTILLDPHHIFISQNSCSQKLFLATVLCQPLIEFFYVEIQI